jgi:hypothetical protein
MATINATDWKQIKKNLENHEIRLKFELGDAEREYIRERGMDIIRLHTTDFVKKRLQPANPRNDGRQTPTKGHPVFLAQHATATSSRICMEEIHGVPVGEPLTDEQVEWTVSVILLWLEEQMAA